MDDATRIPGAGEVGTDGAAVATVAAVRALVAALPTTAAPVVVGVDGPSGAGKTTFADLLARGLGEGTAVPVVHLDDLYPGWDGLDAVVPRLVDGVLAPLASGRPAGYRRWDWAAGTDGAAVAVPAAPLLVVEGAGCGARACAPYLSLLVWLDGPPAWRRERALARDGATYAPYWERWAAQERAHFAREGTRARADLVLERGPRNSVGGGDPPD
ncbi:uridine kinase [Kineosporia sp. R_H_3]|uniref:uridine kinase n=1 Tax=Kineosporia sp. R_H_3 TaxID=1961848 RepID=UPI0018E9136B|nr:uridine kinase [Kineosporia sp. R_H_3]